MTRKADMAVSPERAALLRERVHRTIRLKDGRTLGYAEYGDETGMPVLYFHGSSSSRLDVFFADAPAAERGLRLIGIDRPGVGLSTHQRGRTVVDWPADADALCADLGLGQVGVFAWSSGSQYACAFAALRPERVNAMALVGASAPYGSWSGMKGMATSDRVTITVARHAPPAVAALFAALIKIPSTAMVRKLVTSLAAGEHDRAYLASLPPDVPGVLVKEALRTGFFGTVRDWALVGTPWGFELSDVRAPVDLWQGESDTLGTPWEMEYLLAALPDAVAHHMPGAGHVSTSPLYIEDILSTLKSRMLQAAETAS